MKFQALPLAFSLLATVHAETLVGCYGDAGSLESKGSYPYQSPGYCNNLCTKKGFTVFGLHKGDECWCGKEEPAKDAVVDDDECDAPCSAWPVDSCGGDKAWSVYSVDGASGNSTSTDTMTLPTVSITTTSAAGTETGSATTSPTEEATGSETPSSSAVASPTTTPNSAHRGMRILFW